MKVKFVAKEEYRPKYANPTDACMDIKACLPEGEVIIPSGSIVKIRSGVQAAVPEGYVMQMYVRSSTGIKKNLVLANGTGIIDAGYRDEIIMALHNIGEAPVSVNDGDRLCQFIILPFPKIEAEFVEDDEEFRNGDRGGGIGSTGI